MLFRRVVSYLRATAWPKLKYYVFKKRKGHKDWNIRNTPLTPLWCNFKSYTTYFQYLSWMLNNIYCVPDVKRFPKTRLYVYFHVHKNWRREKRKTSWFIFLCLWDEDPTTGFTYGNILYFMINYMRIIHYWPSYIYKRMGCFNMLKWDLYLAVICLKHGVKHYPLNQSITGI